MSLPEARNPRPGIALALGRIGWVFQPHPGVVVEEDSGSDHGEADDDGPEVELDLVAGPRVADVLPPVERRLVAERPKAVGRHRHRRRHRRCCRRR